MAQRPFYRRFLVGIKLFHPDPTTFWPWFRAGRSPYRRDLRVRSTAEISSSWGSALVLRMVVLYRGSFVSSVWTARSETCVYRGACPSGDTGAVVLTRCVARIQTTGEDCSNWWIYFLPLTRWSMVNWWTGVILLDRALNEFDGTYLLNISRIRGE